ncbi:MAG: YwmB family TATA-box binding protein [Acetivibrionales bacterium]
MKKCIFIVSILVLFISIFIKIIHPNQPETATTALILEAFGKTGARIVSSEVFICGELNAGLYDDELERQRLIKRVIAKAGGNIAVNEPEFAVIDTDFCKGTETDYIIDEDCRIHIGALKEKEGNTAGKYRLVISLVDTSQQPFSSGTVAGLVGLAEELGAKPEVNLSVTGSMEGKLSESEIEELCGKALSSIHADIIDGTRSNELVSITAFSPSIKSAVLVNGKRVNVNMAARYNSYEGRTYIWLATPVIVTEY